MWIFFRFGKKVWSFLNFRLRVQSWLETCALEIGACPLGNSKPRRWSAHVNISYLQLHSRCEHQRRSSCKPSSAPHQSTVLWVLNQNNYLGNVTHPFHGKIRYFADSKSTYIVFKYILSLIWGLSFKENILAHSLSLSTIIHPQKHPKSRRKCWKCSQTQILPASQHNTERQRQTMVSIHLGGNPLRPE